MIRSLLSLVTLSAMMLAAQSTTSDEPFTPETAISLSHDLMRDVRLGNVQRAIISDIQLEIVFMGLSRMAELSASSGSAAEAQSTAQLSDLRNKFTQTTKAKSAGRLPNDPAATAPLLPLAADVELAAQIGDLKSANEAVGRFRAAVFKVAEDQFQKRRDADRERLSGPARDYSDL
ncbi:MAG: hypothetical protein JO138_19615 [Acidobacteriaceae bacterium]|nr:hypothetical protein [Acidobacteriaceae bacterium]